MATEVEGREMRGVFLLSLCSLFSELFNFDKLRSNANFIESTVSSRRTSEQYLELVKEEEKASDTSVLQMVLKEKNHLISIPAGSSHVSA